MDILPSRLHVSRRVCGLLAGQLIRKVSATVYKSQSSCYQPFSSTRQFLQSKGIMSHPTHIPLGLFLWKRIEQLGVGSVMGLPGDMNLELLNYISDTDLHWVGNSNELNAAYAADGYSRIKGCPGVVLTTMGVGELSAINGIAGSYAENVKIIHIVAATGKAAQEQHLVVHHTLGSHPDHRIYEKISSYVRVAHCYLDDEATAAEGIDRVIRECHIHSRPVYIYVPVDMVHKPIPTSLLTKPLLLTRPAEPISTTTTETALNTVLAAIYNSKSPRILVDSLVIQFGATSLIRSLLDILKFPTFSPFMGKSIIREDKPYYHGVYNGQFSYPGIQDAVEKDSDLVIHFGPLPTDMNTGGFTAKVDVEKLVLVDETRVVVKERVFEGVYLKDFITKLLENIDASKIHPPSTLSLPPPSSSSQEFQDYQSQLTQAYLWPRIGKFFRDGDIVFADGGTTHFGLQDAKFPDVTYIMQNHWASIGNALPASFGGAMAQRDMISQVQKETQTSGTEDNGVQRENSEGKGRVILITGEGAMQLTVQEVGSMIREGLDIIIIIINNGGYSIERAVIHPEAEYHNIATWNHKHMLDFFGAQDGAASTHQVRTVAELESVLKLPSFKKPKGVQVLEIFIDKMDFPWTLNAFAESYRNMKSS